MVYFKENGYGIWSIFFESVEYKEIFEFFCFFRWYKFIRFLGSLISWFRKEGDVFLVIKVDEILSA